MENATQGKYTGAEALHNENDEEIMPQPRKQTSSLERGLSIATGLIFGAGQTALCLYEPSLTPYAIAGDLGLCVGAVVDTSIVVDFDGSISQGISAGAASAGISAGCAATVMGVPGIDAFTFGVAGASALIFGASAIVRKYDQQPKQFLYKTLAAATVGACLVYGGHKLEQKRHSQNNVTQNTVEINIFHSHNKE